jgi:ABC-type dipeptide/oligopeptide/nickel transport system permease component
MVGVSMPGFWFGIILIILFFIAGLTLFSLSLLRRGVGIKS